MVVEINHETCNLCGGYNEPLCIDKCPDAALSLRDKRVEVTEFLCEDCRGSENVLYPCVKVTVTLPAMLEV